jgi:hypothetical protein
VNNSDNDQDSSCKANLVTWPAFIKLSGEDELAYLDNVEKWQSMKDDNEMLYTEDDCLIDSSGKVFLLSTAHSHIVICKANKQKCSLTEALVFVREYAVQENYCCSAKINANNFQQILAMIKSISNT